MRLSFHGADQQVTGSCHLLEAGNLRILVDCGMFQGGRELDEDNAAEFGFDASSIDLLLLTHAHLDHCGRIPLLVKRGFRGEIIATAATFELARVVLLDAAHLQEEEALRHLRTARRHGHAAQEPLFSHLDALNAMGQFGRKARYGEVLQLSDEVSVSFHDAGHILGSASIRIEESRNGQSRSIIFSGDLGNRGRPLLNPPELPPHADMVVMETTYGDRLHKPVAPSVDELVAAIVSTIERGGNVIIPTFALERAQEILYFLRENQLNGRIPRGLPVYLDSPMAISATEIFRHYPDDFGQVVRDEFERGIDPFALPGLKLTRQTADSMLINHVTGGAIIMAGSGMCTGGRVRHHLRYNLWREESSVIFVGFAAPGTLARLLIDGAKKVTLFGEEIPVRARLYTINSFSAHADRDELLEWHRALAPARTVLVHGDENVMHHFAGLLDHTETIIPRQGDVLTC